MEQTTIEKLTNRGYKEASMFKGEKVKQFIDTIKLEPDEKIYIKRVEKIIDYTQEDTNAFMFRTTIDVTCVFVVYDGDKLGDAFFQPIFGFRFRTEKDIESLDTIYDEFLKDVDFIWEESGVKGNEGEVSLDA